MDARRSFSRCVIEALECLGAFSPRKARAYEKRSTCNRECRCDSGYERRVELRALVEQQAAI
jgi:hypothetical protein